MALEDSSPSKSSTRSDPTDCSSNGTGSLNGRKTDPAGSTGVREPVTWSRLPWDRPSACSLTAQDNLITTAAMTQGRKTPDPQCGRDWPYDVLCGRITNDKGGRAALDNDDLDQNETDLRTVATDVAEACLKQDDMSAKD